MAGVTPATWEICGQTEDAQETDRINKMSRRYFQYTNNGNRRITPFKPYARADRFRPAQTKDALTSSINLLPKEQGLPVN